MELAWEAYRAGSLPIGAVVADAEGRVPSRGRNRILETSGPSGTLFDNRLAHAEINALLALDHSRHDPGAGVLYTTTEPCPLCVGALRMSDLKQLRYAARDFWAGCAGMFDTVPYVKRGNIRVVGPQDRWLEMCLVAIQVERFLSLKPKVLERFLRLYESVMPEAIQAGRRLHRSKILQNMNEGQAPASAVLQFVDREVDGAT